MELEYLKKSITSINMCYPCRYICIVYKHIYAYAYIALNEKSYNDLARVLTPARRPSLTNWTLPLTIVQQNELLR